MKHWTEYNDSSWEFAAGKRLADMGCDGPFKGPIVSDSWADLFERDKFDVIARKAIRTLNRPKAPKWGIDEQVDLLSRKQHDYGHANIEKFGRQGVRVRLWDKLARLQNLESRGNTPENESVQDTLVDIIGYATIYHMVVDGTFMFPLEEDMERV